MTLAFLPWGGQLLQAGPADAPLLYRSPWPPEAGAAVRGGIPVIFPQFAQSGPLAKHGFARNLPWRLLREAAGLIEAELVVMAGSRADWPHAATLRLLTTRDDDSFTQQLTVRNDGDTVFAFSGGLHPYWAVDDLAAVRVTGVPTPGLGAAEIDAWHPGGGEVVIREGARVLSLTQQGFEGWQVWTPGPAHALRDLPHEDWRRFLCIEPVLMTPRRLLPGEVWTGMLRASAGQADEQEFQ